MEHKGAAPALIFYPRSSILHITLGTAREHYDVGLEEE
jgi:hypothetical protein